MGVVITNSINIFRGVDRNHWWPLQEEYGGGGGGDGGVDFFFMAPCTLFPLSFVVSMPTKCSLEFWAWDTRFVVNDVDYSPFVVTKFPALSNQVIRGDVGNHENHLKKRKSTM